MANFTLIREDKFSDLNFMSEEEIESRKDNPGEAQRSVRRPLLGMEHKTERYAVLRVLTSNNGDLSMFNTSAPQRDKSNESAVYATYTSNILIQAIQESREEKAQVIQTFGDDFVYFFGERPVQLQISAILLDSNNFRWHQEWWENYKTLLRGTQLVRKDARVYLEIQDVLYEGYITRAATSKTADSPRQISLNFSFLVTNKVYLDKIRNRYSKIDTLSKRQIQELAIEGLRATNASLFSSANAALQQQMFKSQGEVIKAFFKGMAEGKPLTTEVQALTLEASLAYLDATGVPDNIIKADFTDRTLGFGKVNYIDTGKMNRRGDAAKRKIKDMYDLQNSLYKLALKDSKEPYYNTSIGEYPNRGMDSTPRPASKVKVITFEQFFTNGGTLLRPLTAEEKKEFTMPGPTRKRKKMKKEVGEIDLNDPTKTVIGRGVVESDPNKLEAFLDDGKRGTLDSFFAGLSDVLGIAATVAVALGNAALLFMAGKEVFDSIDEEGFGTVAGRSASGFFKSVTGQEFDTFDSSEFFFGESPDESEPTFDDQPSGSSSNFNEDTNPTPFSEREEAIEFIEADNSDELVIIEPDFTLFEESVSLGTPEITILE